MLKISPRVKFALSPSAVRCLEVIMAAVEESDALIYNSFLTRLTFRSSAAAVKFYYPRSIHSDSFFEVVEP
jgi:hypothetical protein